MIALNYTVMLNGYSQLCTNSIGISDTQLQANKKDAIKQILKIYRLYVVSTLI